MKNTFILNTAGAAVLAVLLSFSAPAFGDSSDDGDMLSKAEDLVHQAWNPGGDPPSNAQRTDLLNQALQLTQAEPDHHLKKHRAQAMMDIKSALDELKNGDPNNKAVEFIRDADSELRTAQSIAQ
jgi:hypothetical protein